MQSLLQVQCYPVSLAPMKYRMLVLICLLPVVHTYAQSNATIERVAEARILNPDSLPLQRLSFRGLAVVDDNVVWVSGSKGSFARSTDGGKTFTVRRIKGYDSSDFRDIEAFDANRALVMSSGTPAYILQTYDGGNTWRKVFENRNKEIFLDAMDFWNEDRGVVIGDPVNERFVLYQTIDGGSTWHPLDTSMRPWAVAGESLFAASGTCFRCMPNNSIAFVTGGETSVFHWLQLNKKYQRFVLQNFKSSPTSGAFSFDYNSKHIAIAGGDFASDTAKVKHRFYAYTYDKDGLQLLNIKPFYADYRSCIQLSEDGEFFTCGTKGADINHTFQTVTISNAQSRISNDSYNVVKKAKKGNLVVFAGGRGAIGILRRK